MPKLRLVSWNVENLVPTLHVLERPRKYGPARRRVPDLETILERFGRPEVFCLQEVRIRPSDPTAIAAMETALPRYRCHFSLARDAYNARFRGGRAYGVATYVHESVEALPLAPPEWEREGRLLRLVLPGQGVEVVNVYGVNGTDRPHFDHELARWEGTRHDYKRRFQAGLIEELRRGAGDAAPVLLGDWNVARGPADAYPRLRTELPHALARAMFNDTLMPALDVVDVYRALSPESREYTWFNPFAKARLDAARVDFALVARTLLPRVSSATILSDEADRFHSDHAAITLELSAALG